MLDIPNSVWIYKPMVWVFFFFNMQDTLSCFIKTSQKRLEEVERLHKVSPSPSSIFSKRIAEAGGKFDSVDANLMF